MQVSIRKKRIHFLNVNVTHHIKNSEHTINSKIKKYIFVENRNFKKEQKPNRNNLTLVQK